MQTTGGWIKGGKELVGSIDFRAGEGIEQGRFASIGIADDRDYGQLVVLATLAQALAVRLEGIHLALQV